jgi:thiaminase
MYNEWLASMYVCMLFYSRCGKYIKRKKRERNKLMGVLSWC